MTKQVTNCYDCPFQNTDREEGRSCNHPNGTRLDYNDMTDYTKQNEERVPDKCPLRNGGILITIKSISA